MRNAAVPTQQSMRRGPRSVVHLRSAGDFVHGLGFDISATRFVIRAGAEDTHRRMRAEDIENAFLDDLAGFGRKAHGAWLVNCSTRARRALRQYGHRQQDHGRDKRDKSQNNSTHLRSFDYFGKTDTGLPSMAPHKPPRVPSLVDSAALHPPYDIPWYRRYRRRKI